MTAVHLFSHLLSCSFTFVSFVFFVVRRERACMLNRVACARLIFLAGVLALMASEVSAQVVLDRWVHYLGKAGASEWQTDLSPEGESRTIRFPARANPREATLRLRQRDVKLDWPVTLNGRAIGRLVANEADLTHALRVPSGTLKHGENVLTIGPSHGSDDIMLAEITLDERPFEEALRGAALDIRVTDWDSGRPIPARLTIVNERGVLMPITASPSSKLAIRPGVAYTPDGLARLIVRPDKYTIYATRGFEYGVARLTVTVDEGETRPIALTIRREVPTPGLVACDTHVHTLTHSGHGDALLEERLVTLAGEGIELPVATDHDHFTDYSETARRLGLQTTFTPVAGDEVTTRHGHFNAFPFITSEKVPNSRLTHWPDLMRQIRAGSTDRVIVLNHPRDEHSGFRPFGPENFNPAVGVLRDGGTMPVDAIELVNSGAMQSDPMQPVRDWFAIWNHGQEPTAVGASDSHDVSRYIVGQARTYIACPDDKPGSIDVSTACQSLRQGRAVVSLGLLARLTVDEKFGPGDLATGVGEQIRVAVTVLGPSWVRCDRVELFANGVKVREQRMDEVASPGEKARAAWTLPRPRNDVALVAIASGPGVTEPYWPISKPYQPTSKEWTPRVLSITNPVRVDADANGSWNSPRYYAQFAIEIFGTEPTALIRALSAYDEAVATQAAAICLAPGQKTWEPAFTRALESAPKPVRRGFEAVINALPEK